tara:strand:+ start:172 stop:468 length:297 start_codon:yes stop_codon:yes gene_type:complete
VSEKFTQPDTQLEDSTGTAISGVSLLSSLSQADFDNTHTSHLTLVGESGESAIQVHFLIDTFFFQTSVGASEPGALLLTGVGLLALGLRAAGRRVSCS